MEKLTLTINGQAVEATQGMTALEAAQEAESHISTPCHYPNPQPYGDCRLCVVVKE